jgi:hypothetical protein
MQETKEQNIYAAMIMVPSPVLTFCHQQEVLSVHEHLQKIRQSYLDDISHSDGEDKKREEKWMSSHPVYLMDGDKSTFLTSFGMVENKVPHVLVWSARGQGLPSKTCKTHLSLDLLLDHFNSSNSESNTSKWPKIMYVFQKYGAQTAAKRIFEQANKQTIVIWASKEVDAADIFKLIKLTDTLVCDRQCSGKDIEAWLEGSCLQNAKKWGVFKEEDFTCSRYKAKCEASSRTPASMVSYVFRQHARHNLQLDEDSRSEMKLLSSDIKKFRKIVEHVDNSKLTTRDFRSRILIKADYRNDSRDVNRCRRTAYQVCLYFLDKPEFSRIHHVDSLQTSEQVLTMLSKDRLMNKKLLLWVDLSDFELCDGFLHVLKSDSSQKNVILLLTHAPEKLEQANHVMEKLDFKKKFEIKSSSKKPVAASLLHQEIRMKIFSSSQAENFHPELEMLQAVEECIPNCLPSTGGKSSGGRDEFSNVADVLVDDDGSVLVRVCVHDIRYLHRLRDSILGDDDGRFESKLCQGIMEKSEMKVDGLTVKVDRTSVAEIFEEGVLCLSELTPHQEERLSMCRNRADCNLHIKAAAGAGKTFIALHIMQELLQRGGNDVVRVLFVVSNKAMALFVAKWLYIRIGNIVQIERAFARLDLLFPENGQFPEKLVYSVEEDTENDMLELQRKKMESSPSYDLVICDEAHNIFKDETLSKGLQPVLSGHITRLMLLSDISQADREVINFPEGWDFEMVELEEVVRCTKRITIGAKYYQFLESEANKTKCSHDVVGLPISSFLFQMPPDASIKSEEFFQVYAMRTADAVKEKVLERFPGLSLDNRLAILVPDEPKEFKVKLLQYLTPALGHMGAFDFINAEQASSMIDGLERNQEKQRIICDRMGAFDGLERLIVIAVGMDKANAAKSGDGAEVRSQIYRAMTRAHMLVCIVNEHARGGWMEFLRLMSFDSSKFDEQKELEQINLKAATHNIEKHSQIEKHSTTKLTSQKLSLDSPKPAVSVMETPTFPALQETALPKKSHTHETAKEEKQDSVSQEAAESEEHVSNEEHDFQEATEKDTPSIKETAAQRKSFSRNWKEHFRKYQMPIRHEAQRPAPVKRFPSSVFDVKTDFGASNPHSTLEYMPFQQAPSKPLESVSTALCDGTLFTMRDKTDYSLSDGAM